MTTTEHSHNTETDTWTADAELRRRHRAIVADYMSRTGEGRRSRHLLFTEDGEGGLHTADTLDPIVTRGRDRLGMHADWSLRCFPDWRWYNVEIYETQDPNRFWVECDGEGEIRFPGYEPGIYRNHFIHSFVLENGRIKQNREFMNPFNQLRALGIEVPTIHREGIPT